MATGETWRKFLFIPPLLIGGGVLYAMQQVGDADAPPPAEPTPIAVRVATLEPTPFSAMATGFGRTEAARTWSAIAQVEGRAVTVAPSLAVGSLAQQGDLLVEIDPRDYEIATAKAEASLASARSELEELLVTEANTRATLEIEARILEVRVTEFRRQSDLAERGTAAQISLDEAQRALLAQQKVVQDLENQIALFPVQRVALEATVETRAVELEEAERELANTRLTAPFRGRISEESVSEGQYVRVGDTLLTLEDVATSEIIAEFQPEEVRALVLSQGQERIRAAMGRRDNSATLTILNDLGLSATVSVVSSEQRFDWPAELVRITGQIDDATGSVGVVAQVDDPTQPDVATRRPPLPNGAFAELTLSAPPRDVLLAPREAIRRDVDTGSFLYVLDAASTLARADVVLGPVFGDQVVIQSGLEPGATVVLSNPRPAILGMPLTAADGP